MNKTLPLLLLIAAAPAAAISPPAQTQITCPVGGEEFWATMHDSRARIPNLPRQQTGVQNRQIRQIHPR